MVRKECEVMNNDLFKFATIENVDLDLNVFTKEELINCIMNFRTTYFRLKKEIETTIKCGNNTNDLANEYKRKIDDTTNKLELLIKDLKLNQEEEKETGKSYFNTNLFAIRVNEILKIIKGSDK